MSEIAYWFRAGTVSVVAGSNVVTGVATYWLNAVMRPSAGDAFSLDGQRWFEISLIETDGKLRVHGTFENTLSNVSYMIKPVVSASPVLRLQGQIADILGQNRAFFTQLNKFWYEPGEVTVTDPFGQVHTHKTLYSLKQGIDEHSLQLATMIESATDAVQLFGQLQQDVNGLNTTVGALRAEVDGKLTTATAKANEAKAYRDEAFTARNTATTNADLAVATLVTVNTKAAEAATSASTANTKASQASTSASNAATSASDVQTRQADVVTKHNNVVTKHDAVVASQADVTTKHSDVVTKHTDIVAKFNTINTKHTETLAAATTATNSIALSSASATTAQKWAAEGEDIVVNAGLFSARHYSLKAQQYAQQTAANVSGGTSFRGWHNPAGNAFPAGALEGYMYKLSAGATLTFEVDGSVAASAGDYIIKTASGWIHLDDARDSVKTSRTINGLSLASNIVLTAANVGARSDTWVPTFAQVTSKPTTLTGYGITDAVPVARTVNGKPLTANVVLAVADIVGAVPTGDSRLSDSREWTGATIAQAEAEAGVGTTRRAWTAERVAQAIAAQAAPKAATQAAIDEAKAYAIIFGG